MSGGRGVYRSLILLAVIARVIVPARTTDDEIGFGIRQNIDYRLPRNSLPDSYLIKLTPYIISGNFTFDGESTIDLRVTEPTLEIVLHTDSLTYNEALTSLHSVTGVPYTIRNHIYDIDRQFLRLEFESELAVGNYTLNLTYNGLLSSDMTGFYRSSYNSDTGDTVWFAATHFKPIYARKSFPCYDEPGIKTTYVIWIKHEASLHALSNMPIVSKTIDNVDEKIWTVFESTPPISSYLIAFIVSNFDSIQSSTARFNAWSRPNSVAQTEYGWELASLAIESIENYTNIPYALPKMDQISIPDLLTDSMENWGLVTYRESNFLYDQGDTTIETQQRIATEVSHKMAHQWFGNLVSPDWWKYTWVTEGFALYFKYFTSHEIIEHWRLMDQFVVKIQQKIAFVDDALARSHPLNQDVSSPDEVINNFDNIAYAKGAAVIRMMGGFVAIINFRAGITMYLNANAYSSVTSDKLMDAMHDAAVAGWILPLHVDLRTVMQTWTEQMGYPLLTVLRNYTTGTTEVLQERFLIGDPDPSDDHEYRWWIPINWATQSNQNFERTLPWDFIRSQDRSVTINIFNSNDWVIFNVQQIGYYRVNYDDTNWRMITAYLNNDNYASIHAINRAQLIDDSLTLAKAGYLSYSVALDLSTYLYRELDYIPWYSAFACFDDLDRHLRNTDSYESLRAYLRWLTSNIFGTVGIVESETDNHIARLHRINVIKHACGFGEEKCRKMATTAVVAWLDDSDSNAPQVSLRRHIFGGGMRGADAFTWMRLWNRYLTVRETVMGDDILAALACSENTEIIDIFMLFLVNPEFELSITESSNAFLYIIRGSPYGVDGAFHFIVRNLDRMITYFGDVSKIETFLTEIGDRMTTQDQLNELMAFAEIQSVMLDTVLEDAIKRARLNVEWASKYKTEINEWIMNFLPEDSTTTTTEMEVTSPDNIETTTTTENCASISSFSVSTALSIFLLMTID